MYIVMLYVHGHGYTARLFVMFFFSLRVRYGSSSFRVCLCVGGDHRTQRHLYNFLCVSHSTSTSRASICHLCVPCSGELTRIELFSLLGLNSTTTHVRSKARRIGVGQSMELIPKGRRRMQHNFAATFTNEFAKGAFTGFVRHNSEAST